MDSWKHNELVVILNQLDTTNKLNVLQQHGSDLKIEHITHLLDFNVNERHLRALGETLQDASTDTEDEEEETDRPGQSNLTRIVMDRDLARKVLALLLRYIEVLRRAIQTSSHKLAVQVTANEAGGSSMVQEVETSPAFDRAVTPTLDRAETPTLDRAETPTLDRAVTPTLDRAVTPTLDMTVSTTLEGFEIIPAVAQPAAPVQPNKISIAEIAELLPYFDGSTTMFRRWEQQLSLLKIAYQLTDREYRLIFRSRLIGRAAAWINCTPDVDALSNQELLEELTQVFYIRPLQAVRQRKLSALQWQPHETFSSYYHKKLKLAKRVPIPEDQLIECLINGFSHVPLQEVTRRQNYRSKLEMYDAFEMMTSAMRQDGELMTQITLVGPLETHLALREMENRRLSSVDSTCTCHCSGQQE